MSPTNPSKVRKTPRQRRSAETVEAILTAAAHILEKEGFEAATTNRVAQKAGVSIGSLYQYFPNKESLVRALNDHHTQEILDLLRRRFGELREAPLESSVRAMVQTMVEVHRVNPALHRVLVNVVPSVGGLAETRVVEDAATALLTQFLKARKDELRLLDPELSAFMLVHAVEALTHAAVLEHPQLLKGEAFVKEATRMILGYLQDSQEASKLPSRRSGKKHRQC
ncbi:MAG: TetR family transcriptional regulator [Acidobacteriota bacterium]|nr:TetR family transcriptional regulator [Acidobacteriota bacterium]